jgi:hypothetical protein
MMKLKERDEFVGFKREREREKKGFGGFMVAAMGI